MRASLYKLLKSRKFWPLFGSQFLGSFNDNFYKSALAILVGYGIVSVSPFSKGLMINVIAALFVLPLLFFSTIAGQLADKYDKAQFIKIVKFLEIIIGVTAILGFVLNNFVVLLLALLLLAVQYTFFSPAKYSILPTYLQENELIAGNALLDASTFISILIGTILGGVIAEYQHSLIWTGIVMLMVAIAGWFFALFVPKSPAKAPDLKINYNFFAETMEIIRYSRRDIRVFLGILGISWLWMVGFCFLTQFPTLADKVFKAKPDIVNLFLADFTFGIAAGSLLCNRLLKGKLNTTYIPLGILGMSIFFFDFISAAGHIGVANANLTQLMTLGGYLTGIQEWRTIIDLFLMAACGGVYVVPLYVVLQMYPDEKHISRVIASNNIFNALFMVIGVGSVTALLLINISLLHILFVLAIANTVVAVIICGIIPEAVIKYIFQGIFRFFFQVKVNGLENFKKAGDRVLVIANHQSFIDPILIGAFSPRKLVFAIHSIYAESSWMRIIMKLVKLFPVDSSNPMSSKSMIEELRKNQTLMIFPEGRITVTGAMMKIYEGPGLIADKADATILPIRITGAQYTYFSRLRGKVKLSLFPKITLTVLPPQKFSIEPSIKGRARRKIISEKLYDIMTNMYYASFNYKQTLFSKLLNARTIHKKSRKILWDIEKKPMGYDGIIYNSFILGRVIRREIVNSKRVGILLPTSIQAITTFFACQAYGIVPAMINYDLDAVNLQKVLYVSAVKYIITSKKFIIAFDLQDLISQLQNKTKILYIEDLEKHVSMLDRWYGSIYSHFPKLSYRKLASKSVYNNCAVILYEKSTNNKLRAIALSHENLLVNCAQLGSRIDFNLQDIIFNGLPMFESFGLMVGVVLPLLSGIKTFSYPSPSHYRIIPQMVYDVNATIFLGSNKYLANYVDYAHPYDFYSVRYVFAGQRITQETRKAWSEKFGIRILECYAKTAATAVISANTPMHNKIGTVGRFMPKIEYKLEQVAGKSGGRLFIKGPNVMLGSFKLDKPGKIQSPVAGWYDTGDMVTVDEEGYVTIVEE